MRRFAGIDLISDRIPDEVTILTFRHLLEENKLGEQIFETVKSHLNQRGLAMKQSTIIDATLIASPRSTINKDAKRHSEMHQTKNGNLWSFGMKVYFGADKDFGLIHSVETIIANVHVLSPLLDLLDGEEHVVYADSGYQGIEKREEIAGKPIDTRVSMRPG